MHLNLFLAGYIYVQRKIMEEDNESVPYLLSPLHRGNILILESLSVFTSSLLQAKKSPSVSKLICSLV